MALRLKRTAAGGVIRRGAGNHFEVGVAAQVDSVSKRTKVAAVQAGAGPEKSAGVGVDTAAGDGFRNSVTVEISDVGERRKHRPPKVATKNAAPFEHAVVFERDDFGRLRRGDDFRTAVGVNVAREMPAVGRTSIGDRFGVNFSAPVRPSRMREMAVQVLVGDVGGKTISGKPSPSRSPTARGLVTRRLVGAGGEGAALPREQQRGCRPPARG
ncbi:MAG: hypothetical protein IPJ98_20950 [Bryobacterales bacterium]|nr:hypothetical protein [Bryobacterales bacterium]